MQEGGCFFTGKTISKQFQQGVFMSGIASDLELNCEGLNCPLPILKTKKAIDSLQSGQVLKMIATDPGSVNDMASWAKRTGNDLVEHTEEGGKHTFYIKKK
jgi:tRNA 2-thiouridine synthesizing protein A